MLKRSSIDTLEAALGSALETAKSLESMYLLTSIHVARVPKPFSRLHSWGYEGLHSTVIEFMDSFLPIQNAAASLDVAFR